MRMYQSAWNRLKNNPNEPLVISAHGKLHARIYKAIVKEKYMDTVYHLILEDEGKTSKLSKVSQGNALVITLTLSITVEGMF